MVLFAAGPGPARPLSAEAHQRAAAASPPVRAAADLILGLTTVLGGDPAGADAAAEGARLLIRGGHTDRAASLAFFGHTAACLERHEDSDGAFATAVEWAERAGDPGVLSLTAATWAAALVRRGQLSEAAHLSRRALDLADLAPGSRASAEAAAALVALERGDRAASDELVLSAAAQAESREWLPSMWVRLCRLRQHLDDARSGDALEDARWLRETSAQFGIVEPCFVPWARDALTAFIAGGEIEEAGELLTALSRTAEPLPCRWPRAVIAIARAMLAERGGEVAAAEGWFTSAAGDTEAFPPERARVLLEWGAMLRRGGQVVRARPLLGEALQIADGHGAVRLAGHCSDELAVAGGRRRRRSGGDALTAAEVRVARLAVEGLTNAEIGSQLFVSAKTVDTHLQHIYSKLAINSRRELMRSGLPVSSPRAVPTKPARR